MSPPQSVPSLPEHYFFKVPGGLFDTSQQTNTVSTLFAGSGVSAVMSVSHTSSIGRSKWKEKQPVVLQLPSGCQHRNNPLTSTGERWKTSMLCRTINLLPFQLCKWLSNSTGFDQTTENNKQGFSQEIETQCIRSSPNSQLYAIVSMTSKNIDSYTNWYDCVAIMPHLVDFLNELINFS